MSRRILWAFVWLAIAAADGQAAPCTGRFLVEGEALLVGAIASGPDVVVLAAQSVDIASGCGAASVRGKARAHKTQLRARWRSCPTERHQVRFHATIDGACEEVAGTVVVTRPKQKRSFVARRSRCGDSRTDPGGGEQCDDGNSTPGDGCEPGCTFSPPPSSTTTTTTTTTIATSPPPDVPLSLPPPPSPTPVDAAGTWRFTGSIARDDCRTEDPTFESTIVVQQSGEELTGHIGALPASGNADQTGWNLIGGLPCSNGCCVSGGVFADPVAQGRAPGALIVVAVCDGETVCVSVWEGTFVHAQP